MKYAILAILAMLLLAGCAGVAPEEVANDVQAGEVPENVPDLSEVEVPDVEMEDQEDVMKDENVEVDIVDDVVETTINSDVVQGDLGGAPFSEWCIAGQTWDVSEENAEYSAELLGVESYKGSDWCKGETSQTIESPVGDITVSTVYYISEDQTEYWVISDTMGQVNENHIVIE